MHKLLLFLCPVGVLSILSVVGAADTTNQVVTMSTSAINEISLSGSAPTLAITTAVAGSAPTASTSSGISYAITTNESSKKITGSVDSAMPSGTTLALTLAAPSGASSAGAVNLSATSADLVNAISTLNETGLSVDYTFSATAAAGVLSSFNRTVTLTIVDDV